MRVEPIETEDLLFLLYTSGSTAKPKGLVHTTGGYLSASRLPTARCSTSRPIGVYWCAADIGWVTGHCYIVYGPLCTADERALRRGPDFPEQDRNWDIVERYGVTILYTAPTAIRAS